MKETGSAATDALIVVDVQNAFVDALGAEDGARVVKAVDELVTEWAAYDRPIFYTRDIAPFEMTADDLARQTALHPDLVIEGTVVEKGPGKRGNFSAFLLDPAESAGAGGLSTLAPALRDSGATTVTVVGIAADVCVSATARDAVRLGYPTSVMLEATGFVHAHPGGDEQAVTELRAAGVEVVA